MIFDVLTLFPKIFQGFLEESMILKALQQKAVEINLINIRDFTHDKHNSADDYPYGGGAGMVMKPEPLYEAITSVKKEDTPVIYFTPQGKLLQQNHVNEFSQKSHLVLLCGHYKEIDQRIRDSLVTDEYSIGDYVLSGGEIPAMVLIDAITRLQKGVLGDISSAHSDSHQKNLLGCPHYTRPAEFRGMKVPDILLSGNHQQIAKWRNKKAMEITRKNRPDLLEK